MLQYKRMPPDEEFVLIPPDAAWPSAVLFETPEQIYARVFSALRPHSRPPDFTVAFERFANPDSYIRQDGRKISVRITDLLREAPAPVMEALAFILLCKLLRKRTPPIHLHRYRLYLNRHDIRRRAEAARSERGRKVHAGPVGHVYDLECLFDELNARFFHGLMSRPALGWSLQRSRTRLGHFDPSHHIIIISRIFDSPTVPRLALEYVLYHEMLHLKFPVEHGRSRRCVHTAAFKAAEREFPDLDEAKRLLREL